MKVFPGLPPLVDTSSTENWVYHKADMVKSSGALAHEGILEFHCPSLGILLSLEIDSSFLLNDDPPSQECDVS